MSGVRGIHHHDAVVLLLRSNIVRCIIGAVIGVCRSILRKCSLSLVLAYEFEVAVVAACGIATGTLFRCSLTLQSAFSPIPGTTIGLGHWSGPWDRIGIRTFIPDTGTGGCCDGNAEQ